MSSPDDRLTTSEAAALVGVQRSTWHSYVARDQAPRPDGRFDERTPYWLRSTVEEWHRARPRPRNKPSTQ